MDNTIIDYKIWTGDSVVDHDLYKAERELRRSSLRSHLGPDAVVEYFPGEDTNQTVHVSALHQGRLIGCCLFAPSNPVGEESSASGDDNSVVCSFTGRLFQMAVHPDHARCGVGTGLIDTLESYIANRYPCPVRIEIHAREPVVGFYQKLGYVIIPGTQPFIEVGLEHRHMFKIIDQSKLNAA